MRVVLLQDRTEINPGDLEEIKRQLIAAVSTRIAIDPDGIDLQIQPNGSRGTVIVANLPVLPKGRHSAATMAD